MHCEGGQGNVEASVRLLVCDNGDMGTLPPTGCAEDCLVFTGFAHGRWPREGWFKRGRLELRNSEWQK